MKNDETKPENVIEMPQQLPPTQITLNDLQNYVRQWAKVKYDGKQEYHLVYGVLTDFVTELMIDIQKSQTKPESK